MRYFVCFLLTLGWLLPAFAAGLDPDFNWQQIETPHFQIYFPEKEAKLGQHAANLAEEIYPQITEQFEHKPAYKTSIILVDFADMVYGYSNTIYENIMIVPTLPEEEIMGARNSDWLKTVLTHEFTHQVQMDLADGFWKFYRWLTGRLASPNGLLPYWFTEGCAVYNETEYTKGGRGRDAIFNMVARVAVAEDKVPTLSQLGGYYYTPWPGGNTPYYFGYQLTKYLVDQYGKDSIRQISQNHSSSPLYLGVAASGSQISPQLAGGGVNFNMSLIEAVGIGESQLFENWKRDFKKDLVPINPTLSEKLTSRGCFNRYPQWLSDNQTIIFSSWDFKSPPLLKSIDSKSRSERVLSRFPDIYSSLAVSRQGQVVYAQQKNFKQFYYFNDLYLWGGRGENQKRLTYGERAFDPAFSPDGSRVVFVHNQAGNNELKILDLKNQKIETALSFTEIAKISHPAFSPDGEKITLALNQNGFEDIYVVNTDGSGLEPIFTDVYADLAPSFTPDGKFIVFCSDRNGGVYNLFAYALEDKLLYQITDVFSCAIFPSVSPDQKKIAFISYASAGYDVHVMDFEPNKWKKYEYKNQSPPDLKSADLKTYQVQSYNPFSTLTPKIWLPYFYTQDEAGSQAGVLLYGSDAVGLHNYGISLLYGNYSKRFSHTLQYLNRQFYPDIYFTFGDSAYLSSVASGNYWDRQQLQDITLAFPWSLELPGADKVASQTISIGGGIEEHTVVGTVSASSLGILNNWKYNRLHLTWSFSDAEIYGFSNAYERGRTWSVYFEKMLKDLGATFNEEALVVDLLNYFQTPWQQQTFGLRLLGGFSRGDTYYLYKLGGAGLATPLAGGNNYFPLRGYPAARFSGNKVLLGSLEYRFPLLYIEDGPVNFPLFCKRLHAAVFYDLGDAWAGGLWALDLKSGWGAEIISDNYIYNLLPFSFRLGAGYGSRDKSWSYYFQLGGGF